MLVVRVLTTLMLCGLPCIATAQPWADAYRAGDYRKAADLLHPLVVQLSLQDSADAGPVRQLALLYAQGLGVARDPIAACTLAQMADLAEQMVHGPEDIFAYKARLDQSQLFMRKHCEPLTSEERDAAGRSMGCFAFGMPEATLALGSRSVRVGRAGIRLAGTADERGDGLVNCPLLVARVRTVTTPAPPDAAPGIKGRYFVELLAWYGGRDPRTSTLTYELQWQMYERRGERLDAVAMEPIETASTWPSPPLPLDFDARFTLEMIRSGHVRWRLDGAPPKRGWIMLPEEKPQ